ncbi:MAG TPA: hypothetical protein DCZ44_06370 [Flavobacteriaceae bacterium]|nr:hypothetical protein [Flavobacteriaceae bacterium]
MIIFDKIYQNPMNRLILVAILSFILNACSDNSFIINDTSVGPLTDNTHIYELPQLFKGDSLAARRIEGDSLIGEVELYDTNGNVRMIVFPKDETDPKSTLSYLRIIDPKFTTKDGLGVASTFGAFKSRCEVAGLDNAINAVVISFKDTPWYITIDKKELPENVRYNYASKIELAQIPDEAKIKYFFYSW